MNPQTSIKYYVIPAAVLLIVVILTIILSSGKSKTPSNSPTSIPSPTPYPLRPTDNPRLSPTKANSSQSPTIIPVQNFTGADINQTLPPDIKNLGEQKTKLRRLTPLTLPVGVIDFDYENDRFIVTLKVPKNESQTTFETWLKQTYPAIPLEQFAIR